MYRCICMMYGLIRQMSAEENKVQAAEKKARTVAVNTSEQIARNLLARDKYSLEDIAETTGLDLDRVRALAGGDWGSL